MPSWLHPFQALKFDYISFNFSSSRDLLTKAFQENDFLKNLDESQISEIVDSMYPENHDSGSVIIREGDEGKSLYVMEGW